MSQRPKPTLASFLLLLSCIVATAQSAEAQQVTFAKSVDPKSVPEPGGRIIWLLDYQNVGASPVTEVVIHDEVPGFTTFEPDSANFSCDPGPQAHSRCTFQVGSLLPGQVGTLRFITRIDDPLPIAVTAIENCAAIDWEENPNQGQVVRCTTIAVEPRHDLALMKTDGGLSTTEGGLVPYTLRFTNFGGEAVTGVELTESVPLHTRFDAGNSDPRWSCLPNGEAGSVCRLTVGALAAGAADAAVFAVRVLESIPTHILELENTATIADDGATGPDANLANNTATDTTPVLHGGGGGPAPVIEAIKEDILPDPNHDGAANPGEAIIYLVTLRNTGTAAALDAVFATAVDPNTTLLNGTVSTSHGAVVLGNGSGETSIQVELGTLAPNAVATIEFTVIVDLSIPETLDQVSCQGDLTGTNFARTLTDDPETAAPRDPTVTPVFEGEEGSILEVPTLGTWGLIALAGLLGAASVIVLRRNVRRAVP